MHATRGALALASCLVLSACASGPPKDLDDACAIFREKDDWWEAARDAHAHWGVPEPVVLAVIHQESRFRGDSRPPRRKLLGFIPWKRPSSAYGYGQVTESTWREYQERTGNGGADRDDFDDVADFVGWYGNVIHHAVHVAKDDAFNLYLAYHEGPGGFRRGTYHAKPWLLRVARAVARRAERYRVQYAACRHELEDRGWWIF
jgi:hypothetical protein